MKTILLGNGLNRLTYKNSWESLVHAIDEDSKMVEEEKVFIESQIPNTLQFNSKVIKEWIASSQFGQTLKNTESKLKEGIKKEMSGYKPCNLHDILIQFYPDHIITTNYDDVVDKAILKIGNFSYIKNTDPFQEQKFSIRRCRKYWNKNHKITTWNIHGELGYLNSIMLGYDHYCNSIELIDAYLKGKYRYNRRLLKEDSMKTKIINSDANILSWIDLFFFSDIHILGFGFGYEELDLWYVLMKRREMQIEIGPERINNKIFYYGNVRGRGKCELMELYGVNVIPSDVEPDGENFTPVYLNLVDKMSKNINNYATPST